MSDRDPPVVLIHARGRMTPDECDFWGRLGRSLEAHGARLLLIAHHDPKAPLRVPVLRVRNGADSVLPDDLREFRAEPPVLRCGLGDGALLERERLWWGGERDAHHAAARTRALGYFRRFYDAALRAAAPSLTVIWNGEHPQEMILADLAVSVGNTVMRIERGPFAGSLHFDTEGILGGSAAAGAPAWSWRDDAERDRWLAAMDAVTARYRRSLPTWWAQPEAVGPEQLRARLGIAPGSTVLLFAGQVDADVQNLHHNPHFPDNVSAFDWFLANLPPDRPDLFVLGKHHPKSDTPAAAYRERLEHRAPGASWRGAWVEDAALEDALALADRVCAVNSTLLYEALLLDKPALMLGRAILSDKGIAHEIDSPDRGRDRIGAWLAASDFAERSHRWRDFGAHLLARHLFTMDAEQRDQRTTDELAAYLLDHAAPHRPRLAPPSGPPGVLRWAAAAAVQAAA